MRTLVRRLVPGLVLPLLLVGLSPSQAAEPGTAPPTATTEAAPTEAPRPAEVSAALTEAPASLVPDTAPVSHLSSQAVVSGAVSVPRDPAQPVQLGPVKGGLSVGLPATHADTSVVRDGVSIFQDDAAATSYAVNPLAGGGAQFLVAIGGPESPEEYAFPVEVPAGAQLTLTEDGGAQVAGGDGSMLASIPAPWAKDADGRAIPTRFTIVDGALVQVVEHVRAGAAYPVLADPSIFYCDWYQSTCVKFTKGETSEMAFWGWPLPIAAGGLANKLCGKIPGVVSWGCTALVLPYAAGMVYSMRSASSAGRCVEVHFYRFAPAPPWWKTEGC